MCQFFVFTLAAWSASPKMTGNPLAEVNRYESQISKERGEKPFGIGVVIFINSILSKEERS